MEPTWRLGGAQMRTKMAEFRGHFAIPSQEPSRGGFGEGSGWIWEGFWEGLGRISDEFAMILNEIWEGFRFNFRRRVWGGFWMNLGRILERCWMDLRCVLEILANPRNPNESYRIIPNPSES